jgi:hypothetical protein
MPMVELTALTFGKLQKLAIPFVDTPETVIARLAERALSSPDSVFVPPLGHTTERIELDPAFTGNLAFTRVRRARLGTTQISKPNWNKLLRVTHVAGLQELGSFKALSDKTTARIREGKYEIEGYSHVPEGGFSIQGLDSNLAWDSTLRLAKKLGLAVEVEFEWYDRPEAANPGKIGHILWSRDSE